MANKEFLTSVADVYLYDEDDNLFALAKTLVDTSLESALSETEIRGGKGNALLYKYFHSGALTLTLTDAQFNLGLLAGTLGQTLVTGTNVYTEENVTLGIAGAGTVTGTPLAVQTATVYGWVTLVDGTVERVSFTGSNFTSSGAQNDIVCVRYYVADAAARELIIPAQAVPGVYRCVLDAQLASGDASASNIIGKVEITIPKLTLSGSFTIGMTADGVSQTPLTGSALAFTPTGEVGCAVDAVYGYIKKVVYNANWYDDVVALAFTTGDFALTASVTTKQLVVKAIHADGSVSTAPAADLTWASDTPATATVSVGGLVTRVAVGTTTVKATITAATQWDANVICTVSS
jgi:hypothetical protein